MNITVISAWPDVADDNACRATGELARFAREVASIIADKCRHVPQSSRREMAEYIADGIDNALFDIGGRLDGDVFMARAGMGKGGQS